MESTLSGQTTIVRPLDVRDIDAVIEIQTQCREASQWPRREYELLAAPVANDTAPCWVAENDGRVDGFLVARKLTDEMEILNLAVAVAARRKGIASQLLREAMNWAAKNGVSKVHLEVRASNAPAKAFYQSHGFHSTGKRPNYYRDPPEDALLLRTSLRERDSV
ncbi:MAG TPA: ribosomal protein S18-alanine N-acetyltransferase [Candidatus Acidoferrales bacterium]|nr:ribosomal protein S18-alanine N-acetyltransferase [Candidatus Acidoferrales bacterium]